MSTLLQTGSPNQLARFEALLRASKAIASSRDCDRCEDVFARELRSVIPFDYLHVSMFECDRGNTAQSRDGVFLTFMAPSVEFPEAEFPGDEIELMARGYTRTASR